MAAREARVARHANSERRIGSIVAQLMSRRGYASVAADQALLETVSTIVGPTLADSIRIGKLRRGVLQIHAADSVVIQELTFYKQKMVDRLRHEYPQARLTDVRFKVLSD
ncbi:MAG: DUF721 domain-containing protein [Planctomycetota bacterium]